LVKDLVASLSGRNLVIGVDRLDYSKGLIQRLDAFDMFLANHSEWLGKLTYLQITPTNRAEIPEYSELQEPWDPRLAASTANTVRYHGRRSVM
jgi:trehalose 6-phosphate synthase